MGSLGTGAQLKKSGFMFSLEQTAMAKAKKDL
jgi:hypothetical protein